MRSVATFAFTTALAAGAFAAPQGAPEASSAEPVSTTSGGTAEATPTDVTYYPATQGDPSRKLDLQFALLWNAREQIYYDDEYHFVDCAATAESDDERLAEAYVPKLSPDAHVRDVEVLELGKHCKLQIWCHDEDINNVKYRLVEDLGALGPGQKPVVGNMTVEREFYSLCEDESQWLSQISGSCDCETILDEEEEAEKQAQEEAEDAARMAKEAEEADEVPEDLYG